MRAMLAWHVEQATRSLNEAGTTRVESTPLAPVSMHH